MIIAEIVSGDSKRIMFFSRRTHCSPYSAEDVPEGRSCEPLLTKKLTASSPGMRTASFRVNSATGTVKASP